MKNKAYRNVFGDKPLILVRRFTDGENMLVQILNSDGIIEGYVAKGADIVVDNTQSGKTLRDYGLRELELIMEFSAGLYAGPSCAGWKEEKDNEIEQLYGFVVGKRYFDVKFNVPNRNTERLRRYMVSNGLCSDEPTVTRGERYSAVNVLIPKRRFPEIIRTLKQDYGASAIVRNDIKQFVE